MLEPLKDQAGGGVVVVVVVRCSYVVVLGVQCIPGHRLCSTCCTYPVPHFPAGPLITGTCVAVAGSSACPL